MKHRWALPLTLLAALATLALTGSPLRAECLGCPPGAWQVEVELRGGESRSGYLLIHYLHTAERLSRAEILGENIYWRDRPADEPLRLWPRLDRLDPYFEGRCATREGDGVRTVPCTFPLPRGHGFLVGSGDPIPLEEIEGIVDRSVPGEGLQLLGPTFLVREASFDRLARGPAEALRYSPEDGLGTLVYCFALSAELPRERLDELCFDEDHGGIESSTNAPPFIHETPEVLVLVDHPGT